ncbi:cysteine desulfurase [Nonlabens dokdonensis]|jgi:cysteine desulfurase|uniref:Cysteine desulfurase n=2 Tax=Nonlabens dokdonensis TaxID=328515 RepID=L7W9C9_NONDD|nr:cysteine desulfurase family protein [Nonlabens dokdonensis]AGC75488.1 cysteine desulfurase [Nonlabens dokdonensis DSW-6]PZX43184.1 cysteine desulfurase [Nonlabens dokdonensis]
MRQVYLDSAATTQMRPEVIKKMTEVMTEVHGNPSSTHSYGRSAKSLIENARKNIAAQLNVTAAEIIFTSGGTEADNLAIHSCVRDLGVERIITTTIEHHAVLYIVDYCAEKYGTEVAHVKLKDCGTPNYIDLERLLSSSDKKTLVSLMHINNEIGNKLDIDRVCELCKKYGALFHSDCVQSIGHYEMDLQKLPVDFTAVSAHKFHGPKGVGFAFIRKGTGLKPLILGGSQERGIRAGTESVHNIVGMDLALQMAYDSLEEDRAFVVDLKSYFKEELEKHVPGVKFNGNCSDHENSTYTLLNVCLPCPADKAAMLLFTMDLKGIACSKGSACQSGSQKGSHVLTSVLNKEDLKKPSLRFSFSIYNTKEELDYVVQVLKEYMESVVVPVS